VDGEQTCLDLGSELASELYVDEVVDGQGRLLPSTGVLLEGEKSVTFDKTLSVSGSDEDEESVLSDGCDGPHLLGGDLPF